MTSAFRRKHNRGDVTEGTMIDLVSAFFDEALDEFVILPMDEALFNWSFELILEDDLRTLDSLQLAAAISLYSIQFVSYCSSCTVTLSCCQSGFQSTGGRRGAINCSPGC